jgi:hypothetical protein
MEEGRTDYGNPFESDYLGEIDYFGHEVSGFLIVLLFLVVLSVLLLG